jgi:hypothetical protein
MYQQYPIHPAFGKPHSICRLSDGASIPFDPDNVDFQQFKKDILDGAELVDADGQVMDAIQFVNTLP